MLSINTSLSYFLYKTTKNTDNFLTTSFLLNLLQQQILPKHFQPTIIVKAQQEAVNRTAVTDTFNRKSSNESGQESPSYFNQSPQSNHQKLKQSASVKVTVRSNVSQRQGDDRRTQDDMVVTQQIKPKVSEEYFTPPNKQSYFEYKSPKSPPKPPVTATTTIMKEDTFDFDMSELDDLMNYDPNSPPQTKNKTSVETKEVTSNLLDQLQTLEDEMKDSFSSVENSRRSSNSSTTSKSSALYATVQKRTLSTSVSSVGKISLTLTT